VLSLAILPDIGDSRYLKKPVVRISGPYGCDLIVPAGNSYPDDIYTGNRCLFNHPVVDSLVYCTIDQG
jgi:hypothetical protein